MTATDMWQQAAMWENEPTNRWQQARRGIDILVGRRAVYVADGQTSWICERGEWDRAREALTDLPLLDESEEPGAAYGDLCKAIGGAIVTTAGSDEGSESERRALVQIADEDGILPARHYLREKWINEAA